MYGHELAAGMHVHRSVRTRLEARGMRLGHPLCRGGEDTHMYLDDVQGGKDGKGRTRRARREVYVPQVRPALPEKGGASKPRRLTPSEWEESAFCEWVD